MEKENFTPSFFKVEFRAGKTIKQIATEHYVSRIRTNPFVE